MSLQVPLSCLTNSTASFYLNVTFNGAPLDLTNYTPKVIQKASATALDNTGTVYGIGTGLSWVTKILGKLKLVIPAANLPSAGTFWWRLDILDQNSAPYNVFYGALNVKAI